MKSTANASECLYFTTALSLSPFPRSFLPALSQGCKGEELHFFPLCLHCKLQWGLNLDEGP